MMGVRGRIYRYHPLGNRFPYFGPGRGYPALNYGCFFTILDTFGGAALHEEYLTELESFDPLDGRGGLTWRYPRMEAPLWNCQIDCEIYPNGGDGRCNLRCLLDGNAVIPPVGDIHDTAVIDRPLPNPWNPDGFQFSDFEPIPWTNLLMPFVLNRLSVAGFAVPVS